MLLHFSICLYHLSILIIYSLLIAYINCFNRFCVERIRRKIFFSFIFPWYCKLGLGMLQMSALKCQQVAWRIHFTVNVTEEKGPIYLVSSVERFTYFDCFCWASTYENIILYCFVLIVCVIFTWFHMKHWNISFNTIQFYREVLLVPGPTPKLVDHPLSAVHDCLFDIFAETLHIRRPSPPSAVRPKISHPKNSLCWFQPNFSIWFSALRFIP
jgi:hypothetical protein